MGKFDTILDRLNKSASQRDADTAKLKCPKKKKPAIFVVVGRSDTGDGVSGIQVEISKPTKQTPSTNGDGEVKVDPAKKGKHVVRVALTEEQRKKFTAPPAVTTQTVQGQTVVHFFLLEALPTLLFEFRDGETGKPVDGIKVRCGRQPELTSSAGKTDFGGVPAGNYRVTFVLPKPLETKVELYTRGANIGSAEAGHPAEWPLQLVPGEVRVIQAVLTRVRTVEFILVEDGTDKPIVGATLHAKLPGGGISVAVTDQTGCARVSYTKDGKVEIERIEYAEPGSILKVETR